ncbi:MAG: hypothetical protein N3A61_10160, partial [Ignavibacteria bacterium]|nr:hypothetical protein [Ignavibacteria bacterium]
MSKLNKKVRFTKYMMTILEALKSTTTFFDKKGIEDARLNADLLLAKVLNCERVDLYKCFDKPLS